MCIVVVIVVGMILTFRDQISGTIIQYIGNLGGNSNSKSQVPMNQIKYAPSNSAFSSGEVDTYIDSCYAAISATPAADRTTTPCYILIGNFTADANGIMQGITIPGLQGKVTVTADFTKDVVVIVYQDPQGIILVENSQ